MFITDKLKSDIEPLLRFLEREADFLRQGIDAATAFGPDNRRGLVTRALERSLHLVIEGIADVGNTLIDGLIMRDPSSYVDIVAVLLDEQVISDTLAKDLTEIMQIRKVLVQDYLADHEQAIYANAHRHAAVDAFVKAVRTYLAP
ncbi:MAG: DUF86 domain-containing protein [Firmicutes bacterium]|nr:DUF86 domain-containing protein [Bacillota bacterium]